MEATRNTVNVKLGMKVIKLVKNNIKKRLLPRYIHHFKPDVINNIDHMRISGTKPSSLKSLNRNLGNWSSCRMSITFAKGILHIV